MDDMPCANSNNIVCEVVLSRYEDMNLGDGPVLDAIKSKERHESIIEMIEIGEKAKAEFKQKIKELNNGIIK